MSYCRWSSLNWSSDVYVYEHCAGGWTTHVAARRRAIPPIPDVPFDWLPRFGGHWNRETRDVEYPSPWHKRAARLVFRLAGWWYRLHMASLHIIPLHPIGLPEDGATFSDDTPGECADRLEYLRSVGYVVPQYVIDRLRTEESECS